MVYVGHLTWNDEHVGQLKEMWAAGEAVGAIAAKLGVAPHSVLTKARRIKLGFHPKALGRGSLSTTWKVEDRVARLRELWAEGLPVSVIAERLGITHSAVTGKAHRLNLPEHPNSRNKTLKKERAPKPDKPKLNYELKARFEKRPERSAAFVVRPKTKPKPPSMPEVIIADCAIPQAQRCTLLDLTNSTCRWPVGDPGTFDNFFFCGTLEANNAAGRIYCPPHMSRAYRGRTFVREQER